MASAYDGGLSNPHRIGPAASRLEERGAAEQRQGAYPYRFPRDLRQLGGKYTVEQNRQRLLRYFYFERRLAQALGAWTLGIPEFEVTVETGRHIFYHADAARTLRERLSEQEMTIAKVDAFRDSEIDGVFDELLLASDTPELLVGVHQVLGEALSLAYRHHIDDTDPVTDAPTIRALKRVLSDYEPMLSWASSAIAAYVEGGIEESRLEGWRWHLRRLLGSVGGVSGTDERNVAPDGLRSGVQSFERPTYPARDQRFVVFDNTGDYDVADGEPRYTPNTYDFWRLIFLRTQRDEVDAIETFGTLVWDVRFTDFDSEYHLARITWDESRHTEIGHKALTVAGYNPWELPNRLTPSICRGDIEPEYSLAQINLFGEVGIMRTIGGLIERARERDDSLVAHIADFIRSDERTHVKKGQIILRGMTDMGMQDLEYKTRELFTECLVGLGAVVDEGQGLQVLTREEIERLVGE
ncbi:MAG: hypothetical protein ABI577_01205 [bacterium]